MCVRVLRTQRGESLPAVPHGCPGPHAQPHRRAPCHPPSRVLQPLCAQTREAQCRSLVPAPPTARHRDAGAAAAPLPQRVSHWHLTPWATSQPPPHLPSKGQHLILNFSGYDFWSGVSCVGALVLWQCGRGACDRCQGRRPSRVACRWLWAVLARHLGPARRVLACPSALSVAVNK